MYDVAASTDCRNWHRRKNLVIINSEMEINLAVMNSIAGVKSDSCDQHEP